MRVELTSACIAATLLLVSCDQSERNVILEKSPFFQQTIPYKADDTERVISAVRAFATANGIDFLISRDGPEAGDYNVTAAGNDLNFKVIHVRAISASTSDIMVYARAKPTGKDREKAEAFVCVVKDNCRR
jgi:hypothetical protein